MSTGKRFKWAGSKISILVSLISDSPASPVVAITRANPAVVTETAHGRIAGSVIGLDDIVGMTELNGTVQVIDNVTTNTYELVDVDSSEYTPYTSGGLVSTGAMSQLCELTGYNRTGAASATIDATSICSTAVEKETGLPDFGTTQLDFNFAPRTAVQGALEAAYRAGSAMVVRVELPKNGGIMLTRGTVQQTSENAANNGLWKAAATILNSGPRIDIAA